MTGRHWLAVVFSLMMILGCNFSTKLSQHRQAVSTVAPDLPAPPKIASVNKGTPEQQAIYFADLLVSPITRLAGWLSLYDALGIPVLGQDGASLGNTGDDPIGPRYWQLWYASGLDQPGRGIPMSDAGRLLATGTPELEGGALGAVLLDDLRLALKSGDPHVRLMAMFVRERIKRWPSRLDIQDAAVTADNVIIDLPTIQMLGWIAMRGALFQAAGTITKTIGSIREPAAFTMVLFQKSGGGASSQPPCSERMGDADSTYWTNWLMNKGLGGGVQLPGMTKALPGLMEKIQKVLEVPTKMVEKTSAAITKLNLLSVAISFMLQLVAMEIEPSQDPAPMIRTHDTNRGKDGRIELQLYSAPDKIPNGNELAACLGSFAANAMGISFSFPPKGPIAGAEMTVEGGEGFPDLVLFNSEGTNSMRRWTGSDGVAEYKLFGAPQKRDLPDTAKPVAKEFSVYIKAQPEEAGLNSMLNIFFGGLTFGSAPSGAGGIGSLFDVLKGFQYDMGEYAFNLTDWTTPGYSASGQDGPVVYSGTICSLEKPFTVTGTHPLLQYPLKFVPSSATTGTFSYSVNQGMMSMAGSGTYTVEGSTTGKPQIVCKVNSTASVPMASSSGSGIAHIQLVPLDSDQCNEQ